MFLDMKTVFFSYVITDVMCTVFLVFLWFRNRHRFAGLSLWVVHYVMQVASLLLILMRGMAPDFLSIVAANSLIIGGLLALFMGLERFVGKPGKWVPNAAFLAAFVLAHAYFTYVQPDLDARIINVSLGIMVFSVQGAWLLFRRVDNAMRTITRGMGMVLGAYSGVGLLRIILVLSGGHTEENLFESSAFDPIMVLIYQMLFILATYSLSMMVNRRLIGAVQTQEERFRNMVEFSTDWDYWVGSDGSVLYTTPSCEALTGYRPQDFLQNPELRNLIVHPEDQAAFRAHEDEISATLEPRSLDCRIVTRTGETRWINHVCRQVYDAGGGRLGRVASNRDVTERKDMERQLLDAWKDWERIFNAVGHFTLILSPDQRILAVNQMGEKLIGRPASEMMGKQCYEVFHGSAAPPAGCPFSAMRRDGKITAAEMEVETLNRTYMVACTPVLDAAGHLDKVIHVATDITDRKEAQRKLQESEETYRNLFQNAQVGLYRTRISDGKILESNEQLARMFGYDTREEFIAEYVTSRNYVDPGTRERMLDEIQKMGVVKNFEVRFYRKDRSIFWARYSARIYPEKGWIEGVAEDITAGKQAEEEREKLHAQLMQAQKMESVGRLAGGVAHDFNNKLSVILGYTQLAMDDLDRGDPAYGTLQQVLKAGNQSVDIVRQLLAFARKQAIAPEVLDVNEVVEGMLKMLRRLIGEDIDLAWEPGRHLWSVKMDPTQIDQILANLCVNARDAISGVGRVRIETQNTVLKEDYCADHSGAVAGDYVMLGVSDDGCGMDRETLENIFEPFFTTKDVGKGTGLGLATVYGIVKQNQGYIDVDSEPVRGACFRIYLPRHHGAPEEGTETSEPSLVRGRGETILVVEDDQPLMQLTQVILAQAGYQVLSTVSSSEAMEMVRQHEGEINLVLTDVVMPEMSGVELADEIKMIRPGIKSLFMSGYAATAELNHETLERAVPFLEKPFTPNRLTVRVREALGTRNAEVGTGEMWNGEQKIVMDGHALRCREVVMCCHGNALK